LKFTGLGLVLFAATTLGCRSPSSEMSTPSSTVVKPSDGAMRGGTAPSGAPAGNPATSGGSTPRSGTSGSAETRSETRMAAGGPGTVYFPSGARDGAVVGLKKEASTVEAIMGSPFDYRITVTNLTGNALDGVKVTESLDASYNFASSVPSGTRSGNSIVFDLGTLAPNESKTITLSGTGTKQGSITNCSSVAYNVASCWTVKVTQPGLTIAKTMTPGEVLSCDEIKAKVVVTNPGSGITRDVRMTDNLPAGLLTADGKSVVSFDFGALNPGQSKEHTFTLKASKAGTYNNEASCVAAGGLTAKSAPVSVVVKQPSLTLSAECPQGQQQLGRQGVFKYTVKNTSDVDCTGTTVTATMGAGPQFMSADNGGTNAGGKVTWSVGKLAAGESKTLSTTYRLMGAGSVTTNATATCRCAVEATASCSVLVMGVADIGSMLTDDEGVTPVGQNQVYRCEVENQGQVDLTDVKVVGSWPAELAFVAHGASVQAAPAGNTITWNFGTIKPKQKVTWTLTLKASKAGEFVIKTSTTAKEIKNVMNQDEITTFVD
jgi:uncharacterized repeat protein (TIGR01451 family)